MRDLGPSQFTLLLNTFQFCSFQVNSELHVDIYMVPRVVGHPLKNFEGCPLNVRKTSTNQAELVYAPGMLNAAAEQMS